MESSRTLAARCGRRPYSVPGGRRVDLHGRADPARPTSLPAKTAPYTTDARQAQPRTSATGLAEEFRPSAWDLRYYDDDTWIKNHAGDPKAEELYAPPRRGRPCSRAVARGSSQAELEELRAAAGR